MYLVYLRPIFQLQQMLHIGTKTDQIGGVYDALFHGYVGSSIGNASDCKFCPRIPDSPSKPKRSGSNWFATAKCGGLKGGVTRSG
jgi:hypothetical protein